MSIPGWRKCSCIVKSREGRLIAYHVSSRPDWNGSSDGVSIPEAGSLFWSWVLSGGDAISQELLAVWLLLVACHGGIGADEEVAGRGGRKSLIVSGKSKPIMPLHRSSSAGKRYDWDPRIRESVERMPHNSSRGSTVDSARLFAALAESERDTSATDMPRSNSFCSWVRY